jgi:hypothetical protein
MMPPSFRKIFMDGTFTLRPGQSIYSPNKKQQLEMEGDGHLVQYKLKDDGLSLEIIWDPNTDDHAEAYTFFTVKLTWSFTLPTAKPMVYKRYES